MNIAIVDDIAAERAMLRSRLERQLSRRNIQANLLEYDTGEAFLSSCAGFLPFVPDILKKGRLFFIVKTNARQSWCAISISFS